MVQVTQKAPDFKAVAVLEDNSFKEISLSDYKGKKVILYKLTRRRPGRSWRLRASSTGLGV